MENRARNPKSRPKKRHLEFYDQRNQIKNMSKKFSFDRFHKLKYLDNNPILLINCIIKLKNKITVLIKTQRQRSGRSKSVMSCRPTELSGLGYLNKIV
ncbi:hypothetical protein BpHYR1_022929 [Brachionus plicatilis]|uniref:Uncharacterized protein n=1 Tax=Brachionus plicatilis TaxID=10195 RepID=A0A3M7PF45_BRAPC|nr:hypothetical protein BpHYR1_022929 [Brachionus plicatilis]